MKNSSTALSALSTTRLFASTLLIGVLGQFTQSAAGQRVITTLHEGNSTFTYFTSEVDLNAVISDAMVGDTIILPGGPIPMSGTVNIDKRIVLVGAGYHTQGSLVTQPTIIIPGEGPDALSIRVEVQESGSGSTFHGIRFDRAVGHYGSVDSVSYNRCEFNEAFSLSAIGVPFPMPTAANVRIRECIFHETISSGSVMDLAIYNSILVGGLDAGYGTSSAVIDHCTVLGSPLDAETDEGVTYIGCAFTAASGPLSIGQTACFQDCLFILGNNDTVIPNQCWTGQGNQAIDASVELDFIAVPIDELEQYSLTHDYHFLANSVGVTMDVGIYGGGGGAFKPQGIPFNPHWVALTVPPLTQGGLLAPVTISGQAQSY